LDALRPKQWKVITKQVRELASELVLGCYEGNILKKLSAKMMSYFEKLIIQLNLSSQKIVYIN